MSTPTTATARAGASASVNASSSPATPSPSASACSTGSASTASCASATTPPHEGGRCYLVERELEQEGPGAYAALKALVADYLDQARLLDRVPMAGSVVRHYLEALVAP